MLNVLRESFKNTPYLKWILMLVGASLILYLGSYFVSGSGPSQADWVARVNGVEIGQREFRDTARRIDQNYRQLFGSNYERFRDSLQITQQALGTVIDKELIRQDAERMGLETSAAELAEQIRNYPSFQDADGQFIGTQRYKQLVDQTFGGGHLAFERTLADEALADKWAKLVTQPVSVSDDELERIFRKRTEKTGIEYLLLASTAQDVPGELADDELRRWYDEHLDEYRRGEGRRIRYVLIDRTAQQELVEVTVEAVREYLEANASLYAHPEQRRARSILLRLEAGISEEDRAAVRSVAETLLVRLREGEDFATLARSTSQDPETAELGGDLGFFGRGDTFQALEQAVFDTPVGALAPIVETPQGLNIVEVTDSRESGTAPFEEVEEPIRRLLELRAADERVVTESDRLRELMATADGMDGVADLEGLIVETRFVAQGQGLPELGASAEFATTVAALDPGTLSVPLRVSPGMALVAVDEIVPEGPAPLEEIRNDVVEDVLTARAGRAAMDAAVRAHEQFTNPGGAAAALGMEVAESGDLGPGQPIPGIGGTSPELNEALFGDATRIGDTGVVPVPAGALIYQISSRSPFDPQRFDAEKATLRDETLADRRTRYRQSLVDQLRVQQRVEVNNAWLNMLAPTG